MNYTKGNWVKHWYDNGRLNISFENKNTQKLSFKDSVFYNSEETIKEYPNEIFDIMFSGGIDSELVLRSYIELGQKFRVNIFRYENNYNEYDVSFAIKICKDLGIKYTIFNFNLENFYKKEALQVYHDSKCSHARALPQLKFMDYVDGIPIYSSGDIRWCRPHSDYSIKCEWEAQSFEFEIAWEKYAEFKRRKAVMTWFRFTPEIMVGWMHMKWFKNLVSDAYIGKLGVNSTKYIGFREVYPDLIQREKKTGFELAEHIIKPFQDSLLNEKGIGDYAQYCTFGANRLYKDLTGDSYDTILNNR